MLCAVLYTTELRAAKLEEPAVRLLTWNVASLRSTLKKVGIPHLKQKGALHVLVAVSLCPCHYCISARSAQRTINGDIYVYIYCSVDEHAQHILRLLILSICCRIEQLCEVTCHCMQPCCLAGQPGHSSTG